MGGTMTQRQLALLQGAELPKSAVHNTPNHQLPPYPAAVWRVRTENSEGASTLKSSGH